MCRGQTLTSPYRAGRQQKGNCMHKTETPSPVTPESIAQAKAAAQAERDELNAHLLTQEGSIQCWIDENGQLQTLIWANAFQWYR